MLTDYGIFGHKYDNMAIRRAYSFNGKTSVSKTEVPGSSPGGPANKKTCMMQAIRESCLREHGP